MEHDGHSPGSEGIDELLQMEKVSGQTVDAVDVKCVSLTQVFKAGIQTWSVAAITANMVFEYLVKMYIGKLA